MNDGADMIGSHHYIQRPAEKGTKRSSLFTDALELLEVRRTPQCLLLMLDLVHQIRGEGPIGCSIGFPMSGLSSERRGDSTYMIADFDAYD